MNVYTLRTTRKNKNGDGIFLHFGCDFPTIEALIAEINTGRIVYGWNLHTRFERDAEGKFLSITGKEPCGVTVRGLTGVENPKWRFVEYTA